ncbi:GNAT family N-acetyltransferase [Pseudaminobacter sp. 19-2017]|uniref:GNAT family N-acetyltransferase n=1 Tax=Pseudaminobacter soli (ex Zhang et al. 2022) TaxID=2831468 RepID=A0A942DY33_9HYPH|nr:GNAT family N-acetyltransferase [Pseudaminobacter soli]MBS3647055.1 GNAT family N-acetyltransferase [Pseudaminobacter soli]
MPLFRFRQASLADERAVAEFTGRAYAGWTRFLGAPPLPVTEDYVPRILKGEVWLAEQERRLAGVLVVETHPDHLWIFSVAVATERQGQGLGARLLGFAEELASRAGIDVLRLCTNERMEKNIALYESLGYRETNRRPNPKREGWVLVDMEKVLDTQ